MDNLGEELKKFRDEKSWTQPQMADYLDIGYRTYQTIEKSGEVKLVSDLLKIMRALGWNTQNFAFARGRRPSAPAGGNDILEEVLVSSNETNLLVKAILTQQIGYSEALSATIDKVAKNPPGTTVAAAGTIEQRIWNLLKEKGIDAVARR